MADNYPMGSATGLWLHGWKKLDQFVDGIESDALDSIAPLEIPIKAFATAISINRVALFGLIYNCICAGSRGFDAATSYAAKHQQTANREYTQFKRHMGYALIDGLVVFTPFLLVVPVSIFYAIQPKVVNRYYNNLSNYICSNHRQAQIV